MCALDIQFSSFFTSIAELEVVEAKSPPCIFSQFNFVLQVFHSLSIPLVSRLGSKKQTLRQDGFLVSRKTFKGQRGLKARPCSVVTRHEK